MHFFCIVRSQNPLVLNLRNVFPSFSLLCGRRRLSCRTRRGDSDAATSPHAAVLVLAVTPSVCLPPSKARHPHCVVTLSPSKRAVCLADTECSLEAEPWPIESVIKHKNESCKCANIFWGKPLNP